MKYNYPNKDDSNKVTKQICDMLKTLCHGLISEYGICFCVWLHKELYLAVYV